MSGLQTKMFLLHSLTLTIGSKLKHNFRPNCVITISAFDILIFDYVLKHLSVFSQHFSLYFMHILFMSLHLNDVFMFVLWAYKITKYKTRLPRSFISFKHICGVFGYLFVVVCIVVINRTNVMLKYLLYITTYISKYKQMLHNGLVIRTNALGSAVESYKPRLAYQNTGC